MIKFTAQDRQSAKLEREYIKQLEKAYKQAAREINAEIRKMYDRYAVDGKLDWGTMQGQAVLDKKRMTRLQKLERQINAELNSLNRGRLQEMKGFLADVYITNYTGAGAAVATAAGANIDFTGINRDAVYRRMVTPLSENALADLSAKSRLKIKQDLTQGIVQGESVTDMAKRINGSLESDANRAVRIARTETTGTMGQARQDALKKAQDNGIKVKKVWLTAPVQSEDRNRHAVAPGLDGQERDIDEPFNVRGHAMMHPGDQSGPASEVVNCRCTEVARIID